MEKHTTFTSKEQFQQELLNIVDKSYEIYHKIDRALSEDLYPVDQGSYHFITKLLVPENRTERTFYSLLYRNIYQSETLSGDSAKVAYLFALEFIRELMKCQHELPENSTQLISQFESSWNKFKLLAEKHAQIATEADLEKIVYQTCDDPDLGCATWETIKLAGLEGKIFIENGKQPNYIVELKEGYSFDLNPFPFFVDKGAWDRRNVKVMIVDGLVEKVSEIDLILQKAFELKQPTVIIAHGFSEEVAATCKQNMDLGNLDVMPIRMHSDLNSINIISDIATVCGASPITHHMGNLISMTTWDSLAEVPRFRVSRTETTIENPDSRGAVAMQVQRLMSKRQDRGTIDDVKNLLDDRMRRLVSGAVLLHLPDIDTFKNDAYRVRIDLSLRKCKTILNYGFVDLQDIMADYIPDKNDVLDMAFYKTLIELQKTIQKIPTLSITAGTLIPGKTCLMLLSSAGHVEIIS